MNGLTDFTQIDLLRHGETEDKNCFCGSTDSMLNDTGWQQMWASVEQTSMPWQCIITSPLSRCADFAQALADRCVIPVKLDDRLKEIHFGVWEGRAATELILADAGGLARFWTNPLEHPPSDAEHLLDFRERVLAVWQDILEQYAGQKILLVTHGGVIRVLQCHIQNHPIEHLLELDIPHAAMRSVRVEWHEDECRMSIKPVAQV